jgi:hypothetical protein
MSEKFEYFKKADVLLNSILQEMYGLQELDRILAVAITSTAGSNGDEVIVPLNTGGDWVDLLMDETLAMALSHFSRFGIVAPARMAVMRPGDEPESEEAFEYVSTVFICWWEGEIFSATRIARPSDSGDEVSKDGIPYGVPQYSEMGHNGLIASALRVLAEVSSSLKGVA